MTDHELIAKLADECRAFISAAKDDLHLHLIDVPWKNLIAHAEVLVALARQHKTWRHLDRDEEKPEDRQKVLVFNGREVFANRYFAVFGEFEIASECRWWMPLPQPPKEEA